MNTSLTGTGSAPGTCGELIHGTTGDGQPVHVTLPVNRYAHVSLTLQPADSWTFASDAADAARLRASITATSSLLGVGPFTVDGWHRSNIDPSRGLASSTADILAGSRAMANAVLRTLSPEQEQRIAQSIEQTDGTMFPGLLAFNRGTGRVVDRFPWWPQFAIAMVVAPDENSASATAPETPPNPDFDEMLRDLSVAAHHRDGMAFAAAATRSALINQRTTDCEWFPLLDGEAGALRADGVVAGHSGSVAGLLFLVDKHQHSNRGIGPAFRKARRAARALRQMLPSDVVVRSVRTPAADTRRQAPGVFTGRGLH